MKSNIKVNQAIKIKLPIFSVVGIDICVDKGSVICGGVDVMVGCCVLLVVASKSTPALYKQQISIASSDWRYLKYQ